MTLTNAQRQKRYRQKLKAAARASGAGGAGNYAAELLRKKLPDEELLEFLACLIGAIDDPTGENRQDMIGPVLAEIFGLPRDPWPSLTSATFLQMLKRRERQAEQRGHRILWMKIKGVELTFADKLRAALDRAWIETGVT